MTYKDIGLFYVSTVQLLLCVAVFLLGYSLVLSGLPGLIAMLPFVGAWIAIPLLVLVFVPIVAASLITVGAALLGRSSELESGCWVRCAGCTLAVVCCVGGVAEIYAWVLRPLMHSS